MIIPENPTLGPDYGKQIAQLSQAVRAIKLIIESIPADLWESAQERDDLLWQRLDDIDAIALESLQELSLAFTVKGKDKLSITRHNSAGEGQVGQEDAALRRGGGDHPAPPGLDPWGRSPENADYGKEPPEGSTRWAYWHGSRRTEWCPCCGSEMVEHGHHPYCSNSSCGFCMMERTCVGHSPGDGPLRPGDNPVADQLIEENARLRREWYAAVDEIDRLKASLYKIVEDAEVAHQGGLQKDREPSPRGCDITPPESASEVQRYDGGES